MKEGEKKKRGSVFSPFFFPRRRRAALMPIALALSVSRSPSPCSFLEPLSSHTPRSLLTLHSTAARVARAAGQPRERLRLPMTRAAGFAFSFVSVSKSATSGK